MDKSLIFAKVLRFFFVWRALKEEEKGILSSS